MPEEEQEQEKNTDDLADELSGIVNESVTKQLVGLIHNKEKNKLIICQYEDKNKVLAIVDLNHVDRPILEATINALMQYCNHYHKDGDDEYLLTV